MLPPGDRDASGPGSRRQTGGPGVRVAAALFLLGPALIHVAVVPEHLDRYLPYGAFLLLVGVAQVALAAAVLLRPAAPVLLAGAGGNLLVIAVWIASRTSGLPIGPTPGIPEPVGLPDLLATLMEWVAAVLLVVADRRLERPGPFRALRAGPALALAALAATALALAGLAGVSAGGGH